MTKGEEVFKEELALIQDKRIKDFTIKVLNEHTPDWFWTAPASSSGKYHPKYSLGEGGLIRHVKIVAWMAAQFTRANPLTRTETMEYNMGAQLFEDVVVSAAILHDLEKFGSDYNGNKTSLPKDITQSHGILFAKKIHQLEFAGIPVPFAFKCILRGVASHMGPWTLEEDWKPQNQENPVLKKVCECVFYGDYAASRRYPDYIEKMMEENK